MAKRKQGLAKQVLMKRLEEHLAKTEADFTRLRERLPTGAGRGTGQVPAETTYQSMNHDELGYYETLARTVMDEAAEDLAELKALSGNDLVYYEGFRSRIGGLALEALLHELQIFGRTNQAGLAPDRRRNAASYLPMYRRIGTYPLDPLARQRFDENLIRLNSLIAATDPAEAGHADEIRQYKAKARRQRTIYELVILFFLLSVAAIILIMRKKGMPGQ